jgi:hypothetical protein
MEDKKTYLKLATVICTALVLFGVGVMLVGYQPADAKHLGTMAVVAAAAVACGIFARRA